MLLLSSCGHTEQKMPTFWPALVTISRYTEPSVAQDTTQFVNELNEFMGNPITTFAMDLDSFFSYSIAISFSKIPNGNKAGLATIYSDSCFITVYPAAIQYNLLKTVIWHEIAHCAGLMHATESNQIMSSTVREFSSYDSGKLKFFKDTLNAVLGRKVE